MGAKNRSGVRTEERNGRKVLVIDIRFKDENGVERRYRRDARVQQRGAALAEAARLMKLACEKGSVEAEPQAPTFESFVRGDFTRLVLPRLKPSTRKGYREQLEMPERGLLALLGKKRLDAIGISDQREVEAEALARGTKPRNACVVLHSVMKQAYELGAISRPARLPKLPAKSCKLPLAPPEEVVVQVLGAARGWHRVAIALAILGGLRMGEIRALRVRDVNFDERVMYVKLTYSADEIVEPKGVDEAAVPLRLLLVEILGEAIAGKSANDPVVMTAYGDAPCKGAVDCAVRRISMASWHRSRVVVAQTAALLRHKAASQRRSCRSRAPLAAPPAARFNRALCARDSERFGGCSRSSTGKLRGNPESSLSVTA